MDKYRKPFVQTRRDAWVEINISNIEHNLKVLKSYTKDKTKFMAVVKADAYGHGATMIAPVLEASGIDMFGVASVDEALQLREVGVKKAIIVLGAAPEWAFKVAVDNDIQLSIFSEEHIKACEKTYEKLKNKPKVQIKVDTGMNRIGLQYENAKEFIQKVNTNEKLSLEGIFTHLACAENNDRTKQQKEKWDNTLSELKEIKDKNLLIHSVNTSALIAHPDMHYDLVRTGIGLYGLIPDLPDNMNKKLDLKQAIALRGRVIHLKEISENSGISYGYSYITDKTTKVATIPIGYADGIFRRLSNKIYGIVKGRKIKQIGNITMDQMMFDVTDVNIEVGDIITLLGEDSGEFISVDDWAQKLETINYEMTCHLKMRLPRVYKRN